MSVFSFSAHSTTPTTAATKTTNKRYIGKTMSLASMEPRSADGYGSVKGSPPQIMNAASRNSNANPMVIIICASG